MNDEQTERVNSWDLLSLHSLNPMDKSSHEKKALAIDWLRDDQITTTLKEGQEWK